MPGERNGTATPPWQVFARAGAAITGLTLLLFVDVHGAVFYVAWALILLALVSELAATVAYWLTARGSR